VFHWRPKKAKAGSHSLMHCAFHCINCYNNQDKIPEAEGMWDQGMVLIAINYFVYDFVEGAET
jgi:hypothetical protein